MTWSITDLHTASQNTVFGRLKMIWNCIADCTHWETASGDPDPNNDGTGTGGLDYVEVVASATSGGYHEQSITFVIPPSGTEPPSDARRTTGTQNAMVNFIMVNYCSSGTNINRTGQSGQWKTSTDIYAGCPTNQSKFFAAAHASTFTEMYVVESEEVLAVVFKLPNDETDDCCAFNFFGPIIEPITQGLHVDDRIFGVIGCVREVRAIESYASNNVNYFPLNTEHNVFLNNTQTISRVAYGLELNYTAAYGGNLGWRAFNNHFEADTYSSNSGTGFQSTTVQVNQMSDAYFLKDQAGNFYLEPIKCWRQAGGQSTVMTWLRFYGNMRQIHPYGAGFRFQKVLDASNNVLAILLAPSATNMRTAIILSNT